MKFRKISKRYWYTKNQKEQQKGFIALKNFININDKNLLHK
jgi:hypothetical protein